MALNFTNVGMLSSSPRSDSAYFADAQVGGSHCVKASYNEEADNDIPIEVELSSANYIRHLYSSAISADQATADGCSYISAIE